MADSPSTHVLQQNNGNVWSPGESTPHSTVALPLPKRVASQFQTITTEEYLSVTCTIHSTKQKGKYDSQNEGRDLESPSVVTQNKVTPHRDNSDTDESDSAHVSDAAVSNDFTNIGCDLEADLKHEYKTLDYPCITASRFCELLLVNLESMVPISIYDIPEKLSSSQFVYLRGENGSGKRMILHHLAKKWADNRMLQEFKLVFLIVNDELPADFEKISKSIGDSLILLLVYCVSYKNPNSRHSACVQPKFSSKVQCLPNVKILFACEVCPAVYSQSIRHEFQVIGFTKSGLEGFIHSCFSDSPDDLHHWNTWISGNAFASALIFRPLYCAMLVHLHKNGTLSNAIVNFTSLYKEFIVSFVKQYTSSPIQYLSDLKGDDLKMFEDFLCFCCVFVHSPKSAKLSSNRYGLLKEIHPIRFLHHSLPFLLAAMCTKSTRRYDSYNMHGSLLYNLFLLSLKADPKSVFNQHMPSMYESFETQMPTNDRQCLLPEYRIFDSLYWYVYGWCLNNNPEQELHIPPDMPAEYRELAIEMIHMSLKHPKLCDRNMMSISIRGDTEIWNYIEAKQCLGFVTKLHISDITAESCFNDHHFNDLFPYLQSLRIECSNWSSFFDSLSAFRFLENLTIIKPLKSVQNNISSQSSTIGNTQVVATSANFLEAMLTTLSSHKSIVLKTLTICNWDIKHVCFEYLLRMVFQSQILNQVVFNGQCSFNSTNFASFFEQFLQSKLHKVSLPMIDDTLAFEIAAVIKNNIPVESDDKILIISDSSISGSALAPLVSVIESIAPKELSLSLPMEYKYDFHGSRNVSFHGNVLLVDNPLVKYLF